MEIQELLEYAVNHQASDLHLTAGIPPTLRIWGRLVPMAHCPVLTPEDTYQLAYSMMNAFQKQKFERTWELDLSYGVSGLGRFRVNVYRQRGAVGVAIRVIPHQIPRIEDLNLPPILVELTRRPRGLILVTGPTGQGKSTTLAAMIDRINEERSCHIVTIEDPIEYLHPHKRSIVNQRELGFDTRVLSARPAFGPPGRSQRDHGGGDAGSGDHRPGPYCGGDRPPGAGHPAHGDRSAIR
jgi:twitching motility protein PilT